MDKPTKKQLDYIAEIQEVVDEKFNGKTKKEASEYIDRNVLLYHLYFDDTFGIND